MTEEVKRRRRRRHKAAGARVAASGLGASALLGIIGAFGAHATSNSAATKLVSPPLPTAPIAARPARAVDAPTPTTIVWRVIHRVVVVTDPPVARGSYSGGGTRASYSAPRVVTISGPAPGPATAAGPPQVAAPAPAPIPVPAPPAPPACHASKCP